MTHVHYKFSSKRNYNTVVFDGMNITLCELKRLIMSREKLRAADSDLQITNAQTNEEYTDNDSQIPKGSSVIVRRVPSSAGKSSSSIKNSQRPEVYNYNSGFFKAPKDGQKSTGILPIFSQMTDLSSAEVSEDCKIKTIMNQSCYDSSAYQKYGTPLPANYTCYRCGSSEHHIRNCPVGVEKNAEPAVRIKKSTGIPRSFMVKVDDPNIKGAMLTNTGDYAVPALDAEVYAVEKKKILAQEQPAECVADAIPDELLCLLCKDLLNDAVVIPCCGNSYCDDSLLDSEDHVCPTCSQSDVSPDTLIANKFLRQAVNNFTREQSCIQSLKSTPTTSLSQDCTPRPSPAPTPPPQSQPEKSQQVEDTCKIISSDSPPNTTSTSLNVVKVLDETSEREADMKKIPSPATSPAVLVSDTVMCDSRSQPVAPINSVTQAVADISKSGSTPQSDQAPHWDKSTSVAVSEGWTAISAHPPASSSSTFSVPQSLSIMPSHFQTYLQQQALSSYPPCFSTTTPLWPSGLSPQGAPIPAFISSPTPAIPPLLPKELMLYHRKNKERTPPRGSSYNAPSSFSSKSRRSKSSHSSSRSPSQSRSHDKTRHYSSHSSRRDMSSSSHSSHSYSHSSKQSYSPSTTSKSSHSQHRSRSPADRHKSRHHSHHHHSSNSSSSTSSRRRRDREGSEWSYDAYLRWKREYTDWCEKYFNSYFSHFHQMPPPPLLPPPQPHLPGHSPYHGLSEQPAPSSESRSSHSQSYSEYSSTTTHSSSSYSDSTPTQSFSDSNSPRSNDCSWVSQKNEKVDENQNKVKERRKQKTRNRDRPKSPPKKHKSKVENKKAKDLKWSCKEKERSRPEKEEKRHGVKASEKRSRTDADRSRQPGHSKSPDSRSDKSKMRRDEETLRYQRENIQIESSSGSDIFPKELEREKPKKAIWKPQPLTKENAWEGGVKVKPQKKINININLDGKKNEDDKPDVAESHETTAAESYAKRNQIYNQVGVNQSEERLNPNYGIKDVKNDSWEISLDDETITGEDSDLWQCALTAVEDEEGKDEEQEKSVGVTEEDMKPHGQEDMLNSNKNCERTSMIKDDSCFKMEQGGSVITCEGQKIAVKDPVEEKRSMERNTGHIKIPSSRWERDGFEKERQARVSSHLREGQGKAKRRLVEVENPDEAESAGLDNMVAPSSGGGETDSGFDFGRKEKKKAERESERRKREESSHHKERESYSTLNSKSSNGPSRASTFILDAENRNRSREGKSCKVNMELDIDWKGKYAYSKHCDHDSQRDLKVHLNRSTPSHSQPDSRDRGQVPSRTSTTEDDHHGQSWIHTSQRSAPPSAKSSPSTSSDLGKKRNEGEEKERDAKNENQRDKKKQKSHKREKRHSGSDEMSKSKMKNKDHEQMDFSKSYLPVKHT